MYFLQFGSNITGLINKSALRSVVVVIACFFANDLNSLLETSFEECVSLLKSACDFQNFESAELIASQID